MLKIFRDFSSENNKKDFILARRIIEIILYLTASIQLFQEFSDSRYFDQFMIILSCLGMYVFYFGALKKMFYIIENFETEYYIGQKEMMDFHNNFIASMFIPMIFLFKTDERIFTGTSLWDLDSMKKIILLITFCSLIYYRFLVFYAKRYSEKIKINEEYEGSDNVSRYYNGLLYLSIFGFLLDFCLCILNIELFSSMEWKNNFFANTTLDISSFLLLCVLVLFFINDKKRIVLSVLLTITVSYISYSSYMQFSEVKTYNFGTADYTDYLIFDKETNKYADVICHFGVDENNNGIFKYYILLLEKTEEGYKIIEEAFASGNYESTEYKNTFSEWQDRDSDTYFRKKDLEKGEKPVSFKITNEKVKCEKGGLLEEYIDSKQYVKVNFYDEKTDSVIVGDGYINFRGNILEKSDRLDGYLDKMFERAKI
ncbi:MAG: hypothetical protein E7419_01555 [Ruminococcaceae bacterium]|nr:hypothetical protein [Oscillospiraceae bacterium]